MNLKRILATLSAFITLATSLLVYLEYIYLLGFPDGFITDLEYAQRNLAYIFIAISVIASLYFLYLFLTSANKQIGKKLTVVAVLYLIFAVSLFLLDSYYRSHLSNSNG
jgi:hypothetical protein